MKIFRTDQEKKLWICAFVVVIAIFSTLFIGQPLVDLFQNQNTQAWIFGSVMILVGTTILVHGVKTKPGKLELTLILGIVAVYVMFFLRLGLSERTHLMEYSVLAIFIHKALNERIGTKKGFISVALISFFITFIIGVIDEGLQFFLPNRVFDVEDIIFNRMAAAMAMVFSILMQWFRSKKTNDRAN